MRHGSYRHSRGLWLVMAVAVLLVAPGAEHGIGQQSITTPQEPANVAKRPSELPREGIVTSDLGIVGHIVLERADAVPTPIRSTRVYDVSDLIERIVADDAANKEQAPKDLERILTCYEAPVLPPTGIDTLTASPAPVPAPPLPLNANPKADGEFSLQNGKFIATTSETNHQRINTDLARYREFGFKLFHCSVEIFCGPDELSLEGLKWKNAETKLPNSWGMAILDRSQANSVTKFVSQQNRIARLMSPHLCLSNGTTGSVVVGTNVSSKPKVILESDPVLNEDRFEGVRVDLTALIRPEDRIWIEFRLTGFHSDGEPVPPTMHKKRRTFFINTAVELHKDEFLAFRLQAPETESPQKGKCYFAVIHAEPLNANEDGKLPSAANVDDRQNASSDSNTNKVIAIPRFDIE